jgi:hypothetical protein
MSEGWDGAPYDAKLKTLFRAMFPDHPFDVMPTKVAARQPPQQVQGRQGTEMAIGTALPSGFSANAVISELPTEVDRDVVIPSRYKRNYVYALREFTDYATCTVATDDALRKKLGDSANVLQRYVGSYIAAMIELLLDVYFHRGTQIGVQNKIVQHNVMNFDWKVSNGGTGDFFRNITINLLRDLREAMPTDYADGDFHMLFERSASQLRADGTYIDYAVRADEPRIEQTVGDCHLCGIPGVLTQFYTMKDVYVELKVKETGNHLKSSHFKRAIESINRHDVDIASACFCLSHCSDDTGNSTATTTAFRIEPGRESYEYRHSGYPNSACVKSIPTVHEIESTFAFTDQSGVRRNKTAYWKREGDIWVPRISTNNMAGLWVEDKDNAYLFEYVLDENDNIKQGGVAGVRTDSKNRQRRIIARGCKFAGTLYKGMRITWDENGLNGHILDAVPGAGRPLTDASLNEHTPDVRIYDEESRLFYETNDTQTQCHPVAMTTGMEWKPGTYFNGDIPTLTGKLVNSPTDLHPLTGGEELSIIPVCDDNGRVYATAGNSNLAVWGQNMLLGSSAYSPAPDAGEGV